MGTAVVRIDADGHATLRTPYVAGFVSDLKAAIPLHGREWQPVTRSWWIARPWVDQAIGVCRRWYAEVEVIQATATGPSAAALDGPYAALHLLPSAPWPVVEVVYRKLAAIHHPDRGGDVREMQDINAAFDRIRQLRGG